MLPMAGLFVVVQFTSTVPRIILKLNHFIFLTDGMVAHVPVSKATGYLQAAYSQYHY